MAINEIDIKREFKNQLKEMQEFWKTSGASEHIFIFLTESYDAERRNDRRFREHNISIEGNAYQDDVPCSIDDSPQVWQHWEKFSMTIGDEWISGQYEWLHEVEHKGLCEATKLLSECEKRLLTLKYKDCEKQGDIAKMLGVSDATISKRLRKIVGKLRASLLGGDDDDR